MTGRAVVVMLDLLWLDGTWSKPGARSLVSEALRDKLNGGVRFRYVDYPAEFSEATGRGDMSFGDSVAAGMRALSDAVAASPNIVVVGGYSQGAAAAVGYAREILPRSPSHEVLAVAALGNPHQPVHFGRSGIAGALSVPRPLLSLYAPGDPIADLALGSPLRSIADVSEWMSLRSPEDAQTWARDLIEKAIDAKVQAWWMPWRWRDVNGAVAAANAYFGTAHTLDYITGGHVARLARRIEGLA